MLFTITKIKYLGVSLWEHIGFYGGWKLQNTDGKKIKEDLNKWKMYYICWVEDYTR